MISSHFKFEFQLSNRSFPVGLELLLSPCTRKARSLAQTALLALQPFLGLCVFLLSRSCLDVVLRCWWLHYYFRYRIRSLLHLRVKISSFMSWCELWGWELCGSSTLWFSRSRDCICILNLFPSDCWNWTGDQMCIIRCSFYFCCRVMVFTIEQLHVVYWTKQSSEAPDFSPPSSTCKLVIFLFSRSLPLLYLNFVHKLNVPLCPYLLLI